MQAKRVSVDSEKQAKTEVFQNAYVATAILFLLESLLSSVSVWTAKQFENDNVDEEH